MSESKSAKENWSGVHFDASFFIKEDVEIMCFNNVRQFASHTTFRAINSIGLCRRLCVHHVQFGTWKGSTSMLCVRINRPAACDVSCAVLAISTCPIYHARDSSARYTNIAGNLPNKEQWQKTRPKKNEQSKQRERGSWYVVQSTAMVWTTAHTTQLAQRKKKKAAEAGTASGSQTPVSVDTLSLPSGRTSLDDVRAENEKSKKADARDQGGKPADVREGTSEGETEAVEEGKPEKADIKEKPQPAARAEEAAELNQETLDGPAPVEEETPTPEPPKESKKSKKKAAKKEKQEAAKATDAGAEGKVEEDAATEEAIEDTAQMEQPSAGSSQDERKTIETSETEKSGLEASSAELTLQPEAKKTAKTTEEASNESLANLQETVSLLLNERSEFQSQLSSLRSELEKAQGDSKLLEQGRELIKNLEEEKRSLEFQLNEVQEKAAGIEGLESEVKSAGSELDRIKKAKESLQEEKERLESELVAQRDAEKERVGELEKAIERSREREGGLEAEIGRLRQVCLSFNIRNSYPQADLSMTEP